MTAYFARSYFTIPIQLALNTFFIIACALHYKKLKGLRGIWLYSVFTLAQCISGVYLNMSTSSESGKRLLENVMPVFMAIEFILFYLFLISSIRSRLFTFILKAAMVIFPATILYFRAFVPFSHYPFAGFTMAETYLIVIPCLFYYYEFFMTATAIHLFNEPRLWTISGMLFLFALLSPFFLPGPVPYMVMYEPSGIYAVAFIGYIILFIFFITALACQIRIRK